MKKMLFVVLCLQLSVFLFPLSICEAQVGTWRAYMSYYEPQQIVKGGHILFVRASNSLYTYNLNDQSITTYDKVNALNDTYITHIAWNDAAKRLIIVYKNSNIDLIDREDHVNNISAIYSKSMTQDKTINSIYLHDIYAYLSTGFGIVKINMQRAEVAESYILNENIKAVCINGGSIFAKTASDSVLTAPLSSNLIDFHNWTAGTAPDELFVQDNSDWDNYIDIVQTLKPDGPKYNYFGFLRSYQGRLYSCGGGYSVVQDLNRPAALQMMDSEKTWTTFPEDISEQTGVRYLDLNCVDIDPFDPQRVFASGRTGIYEFKNVQLINHYNNSNTILKGYHDDKNYVTIQGIRFDNHGSLWCLNSMRRDINVVEFTPDNQWVSHFQENLTVDNVPMANMTKPFFDARGLLWFVNDSYLNPSVICYDPAADKLYRMSQFVNQDGVSTKITYIHGITDDKEGNIWIGTNMGLFVILSDDVANAPDVVFNQIKVPRNDGSNYADYLLSGIVMAFVRGVMCASTLSGSICSVFGSISQKTTVAPSVNAPVQLAQYVTDVQIISSPGPRPTANIAAFSAFVPVLCANAYLRCCHAANSVSNCFVMFRPDMLPSSKTSSMAFRISSFTIGQ